MATSRLTFNQSSVLTTQKSRQTVHNQRHPCFTLKRPLIFQLRKSLVEYVDEELYNMDTSVFYQRVFILAKNVDPIRESHLAAQAAAAVAKADRILASNPDVDTVTLRTAEVMLGEDEQHYSQASTPNDVSLTKGETAVGEEVVEQTGAGISGPVDPDKETVTRTFKFDWDDEAQVEEETEETEIEPEPEAAAGPKDTYTLFYEMLQDLQKKCRRLSYTPDPMCGLLVYMNDYTMLMLESGEDMMGIFCSELLGCIDQFWQSNRVVLIEDRIKDLYTKELLFRRIPAVFLNEKFPPSTPTDEYLMGKQHLIIKEKMHTICRLVKESLELPCAESAITDAEEEVSDEEHVSHEEEPTRVSYANKRATLRLTATLAPDVFRKLLPEIQRIELVLASTRFYYTLDQFVDLYGKVPFGRDDDSFYWPIQNNYAPPNIFRRTPFDINLTFADYAAEMNRRMQEEQEKQRAEQEAAAAAEASAADQAQQGQQRPHASQSQRKEESQEE